MGSGFKSKFQIETKEVNGKGEIADLTVVMGPNAHVFVTLLSGRYRGVGSLELSGYGSVKCDDNSCARQFRVPLYLYHCRHDVGSEVLGRELERMEEKSSALLVFDRVFDVMYPSDVIEYAYTLAKLATRGIKSIVVTHHSFVADVFTRIDAVAEYLQRDHLQVSNAINILTDTVTTDDYLLTPYSRIFINFYAHVYK